MFMSCFCFKVTSQNEINVSFIIQKGIYSREMRRCDIQLAKAQ